MVMLEVCMLESFFFLPKCHKMMFEESVITLMKVTKGLHRGADTTQWGKCNRQKRQKWPLPPKKFRRTEDEVNLIALMHIHTNKENKYRNKWMWCEIQYYPYSSYCHKRFRRLWNLVTMDKFINCHVLHWVKYFSLCFEEEALKMNNPPLGSYPDNIY